MICRPCREQKHEECDNVTKVSSTPADGVPVTPNWCDCAHVTGQDAINRQLVPQSPESNTIT